jgi:hypothetical protein
MQYISEERMGNITHYITDTDKYVRNEELIWNAECVDIHLSVQSSVSVVL